jgi:hypothetical protein
LPGRLSLQLSQHTGHRRFQVLRLASSLRRGGGIGRQLGLDGGDVHMSAEGLVAYVNGRNGGIECQGVGHLIYGIKKVKGDRWGWPVKTDQDGRREAAATWLEYGASL